MMAGETVYVDGEPVDNVLVRPGEHVDGTDIEVPAGVVIAYTLAFPASYPGSISNARVTVRGRECDTVGFCDHARPQDVFCGMWDGELCPWDMTVPVQLCEGDMRASVSIIATSSTYGADGRPARTSATVYSGEAQARMSDGAEERAPDGSKRSVETWFFVVPWQEEFSGLRPEHVAVEMDGASYDVRRIVDVGGRSQFASIEATRRG